LLPISSAIQDLNRTPKKGQRDTKEEEEEEEEVTLGFANWTTSPK
jgi:hypothetical protein